MDLSYPGATVIDATTSRGRRMVLKKRPTAASLEKKVNAIQRQFKAEQNVGFKETYTASNAASSGSFILLNGLSQGSAQDNRIGDQAHMNSIRVRMQTSAIDATNTMRLIVFLDKAPKGVAPTQSELLETSVIGPAVFAFTNPDNKERFTILYDKTWVQNGAAGADSLIKFVKANLKLNAKTNYGLGNAGTIADISHNAIYAFIVSDSGITAHPTFNLATRVKFIE